MSNDVADKLLAAIGATQEDYAEAQRLREELGVKAGQHMVDQIQAAIRRGEATARHEAILKILELTSHQPMPTAQIRR